MTDPVRDYCREKGYAHHVVQGGMSVLVDCWEKDVQSIANGEIQYQDDYLNDMDGRQIIEEVLAFATPEQKAQFVERIAAAEPPQTPSHQALLRYRWKMEAAPLISASKTSR